MSNLDHLFITDEKQLHRSTHSVIVELAEPRNKAKLSNAIYHLWLTINEFTDDQGQTYSEAANYILSIVCEHDHPEMLKILRGLKHLRSHNPRADYVKALKL